MENKKKAESIAWVVIAISLLSVVMLWLLNIINYNDNVFVEQDDWIKKILLEKNSVNIWNKVDIKNVAVWEDFYVFRDDTTKEYKVFTWSSNEQYKNIDHNWNFVSSWAYERTYKKLWNFWEVLGSSTNLEVNNFDLEIK